MLRAPGLLLWCLTGAAVVGGSQGNGSSSWSQGLEQDGQDLPIRANCTGSWDFVDACTKPAGATCQRKRRYTVRAAAVNGGASCSAVNEAEEVVSCPDTACGTRFAKSVSLNEDITLDQLRASIADLVTGGDDQVISAAAPAVLSYFLVERVRVLLKSHVAYCCLRCVAQAVLVTSYSQTAEATTTLVGLPATGWQAQFGDTVLAAMASTSRVALTNRTTLAVIESIRLITTAGRRLQSGSQNVGYTINGKRNVQVGSLLKAADFQQNLRTQINATGRAAGSSCSWCAAAASSATFSNEVASVATSATFSVPPSDSMSFEQVAVALSDDAISARLSNDTGKSVQVTPQLTASSPPAPPQDDDSNGGTMLVIIAIVLLALVGCAFVGWRLLGKGSKNSADEAPAPREHSVRGDRGQARDIELGERQALVDQQQFAPLYVAVRDNDVPRVQQLLGQGADVNEATKGGSTPLCRAAQEGHLEAMRVLLNNPNIAIEQSRGGGRTALFIAVQFGHVDCVRLLLEYGANPLVNVVGKKGRTWTAIDFAEKQCAEASNETDKACFGAIVGALTAQASADGNLAPATPAQRRPSDGDQSGQSNRLAALMGAGVAEHIENLPAGWKTAVSKSTGQQYYVNTVTGETTYDRPTVPAIAPAEVPSARKTAPFIPSRDHGGVHSDSDTSADDDIVMRGAGVSNGVSTQQRQVRTYTR
jgi:hypothetical protein